MLTNEGHIFVAEQAEIRRLAADGSAVFLGHCASEAIKDRSGVIKVFIRGENKDKLKRIVEDYRIPENIAEATMKRFDKKRSNYYYANTLKHWNDFKNYDIVLNSSTLGIDGCVNVLSGLLK